MPGVGGRAAPGGKGSGDPRESRGDGIFGAVGPAGGRAAGQAKNLGERFPECVCAIISYAYVGLRITPN
jgi:hypothetical protein